VNTKDKISTIKVCNFLQYKGAEAPTKKDMKVWSRAIKKYLEELFKTPGAKRRGVPRAPEGSEE